MAHTLDFAIREAQPSDATTLVDLIRQLAIYEKLEDQAKATEEQIRKTLFGDDRVAYALIAETATTTGEPQVAGFALYFFSYSTFLARPGLYLEDLFVDPKFRSHGLGKRLLSKLAQIAELKNCGRMEWAVLNWNEPAIRVYEKIGARPQSGWTTYRLTESGIHQLARS